MTGVDATRILFVCTANRCRSVMAESLATRRFASPTFEFASAGLLDGGLPTPPNGVRVAAEQGIDLSGHVSRKVDPQRFGEWDLVLTMSRRHTRELVAVDPGLWPRTFTLPQFARWIEANPPGRHATLRTWIETAAATRSREEMVGHWPEDEIADPVDGPPRAWRELVATLAGQLDGIALRLLGNGHAAASDPHPLRDPIAEGCAVEQLRPTPAGLGVRREGPLHGAAKLPSVEGVQ